MATVAPSDAPPLSLLSATASCQDLGDRRKPSTQTLTCHQLIQEGDGGLVPAPTDAVLCNKATQKKTDKYLTGVLECALIIVLLGCSVWTLWLILLTVRPNSTINRVMNTEHYDGGTFWLLIEPTATMKLVGMCGFAIVLSGYVFIILKLTLLRKHAVQPVESSSRLNSMHKRIRSLASGVHQSITDIANDPNRNAITTCAAHLAVELASETSQTRKFMNAGVKVVDLTLQLVLLVRTLESGYPPVLIYLLTVIIVLNSAVCALMMCLSRVQSQFLQMLVNCAFDFLIAVGFPMVVLTYCLSTFAFDRAKLAINEALFPLGRFERMARVIADPVQTAIILDCLNSLRIQSALSFFVRVGMNLALCLHFAILVPHIRRPKRTTESGLYPYCRPVALLFILIPVAIAVYVSQSVRSSEAACSHHPECAVHAFRWITIRDGDKTQCPCLTLIDVDVAPKTYAEWLLPKNVTEKVAQLAASGDLQTIQLTNRYLPAFPDELRRCTNMRHIALAYAHTATLPSWSREFTKLEYLHIEGTLGISSLESLPDGMFADMELLTFLHLAVHPNLRRLPSFNGLVNLRSLTLAILLQLEELPDFASLANLEHLVLPIVPKLDAFPDMTQIKNLQEFVLSYRSGVCCNGFLDNKCDLNKPICALPYLWGEAPVTCLPTDRSDKIATEATRSTFARFPYSVCSDVIEDPATQDDIPTEEDMLKCNGTMYRRCEKQPGNRTGICYNPRMMPISCDGNSLPIAMRKRQIAENVGDPCDPEHEAWLGCVASR